MSLEKTIEILQQEFREKKKRNDELDKEYQGIIDKKNKAVEDLKAEQNKTEQAHIELDARVRVLHTQDLQLKAQKSDLTEMANSLNAQKGEFDNKQKKFEKDKFDFQLYKQKENEHLAILENDKNRLIKNLQEKINELQRKEEELITSKTQEMARKMSLVDMALADAEKSKQEHQQKINTLDSLKNELNSKKESLDKRENDLKQYDIQLKNQKTSNDEKERELGEQSVYLQALNKRVNELIELNQLRKELEKDGLLKVKQ